MWFHTNKAEKSPQDSIVPHSGVFKANRRQKDGGLKPKLHSSRHDVGQERLLIFRNNTFLLLINETPNSHLKEFL